MNAHEWKPPQPKTAKKHSYTLMCGECLHPFSSLDWADPAKALLEHKATSCKYRHVS